MRFFGKSSGKNDRPRANPAPRGAASDVRRFPALEALEGRMLFSVSAGDLDAAFGSGGLAAASSTLSGISAAHAAVQADGKVVVVGRSEDRFAVARFKADGTPDPSFGASGTGVVLTQAGPDGASSQATSVAIQADGKIIVVGRDSKLETFDLVRYLPNGTPDTSFGSSGIVHTNLDDLVGFPSGVVGEIAADVAVQADGKIVVAGTAAVHGFLSAATNQFAVVRYNSNGTVDGSFGDDSGAQVTDFDDNNSAEAVAIDNNGTPATNPLYGTIVVAGTHFNGSGLSQVAVARLSPNGHLDGRFDGDGQLAASLSANTSVAGSGAVIAPGGNVIVAGSVSNRGDLSHHDFALVEFGSDGKIVPGFGSSSTGWQRTDFGGNDQANAVIRGFDGDLVVGGASNGKFALAAYTSDGKLDPRFSGDGKLTTGVGETTAVTGLAAAPGRRFIAVGSGSVFHAARYFDIVPTVNVGTFNPNAFERGTKPTSFLVTRSERLPFATRVRLTLGGTARLRVIPVVKAGRASAAGATGVTGVRGPVFGTGDYTLSGVGSDAQGYYVHIPAGQTFATVTVIPVDNGITNNSVKTAVFTVQNDNLYDVGTLPSVTINIHENDLPILHLPLGRPVVVSKKV